MFSLIAVIVLFLLAYIGVEAAGLQILFGIVIPYVALLVFVIGFVNRVIGWARSPVPFRIPSTCGQQKSLPWIKSEELDNPHSTLGVIARMFLEIVFFRSLIQEYKSHLERWPKDFI